MYKQLSELLAAARLISRSSGAKIKELEEHLGISRRSVYRLLDTLEELGYPIYDEFDGKERVIRLNEDRDNLRWWLPFPKLHFSREDMVLLEFLFREAAGTPAIAGEIARLKEKLAPILAEGGYALTAMGSPDWNQPTILHSPWITRPCSETTNQHV
ncbi:MAG TPA: HTH domain-containing protein, partial [Treponema sp.]|nr:HTH domain-containing protein [Treponema sp.]